MSDDQQQVSQADYWVLSRCQRLRFYVRWLLCGAVTGDPLDENSRLKGVLGLADLWAAYMPHMAQVFRETCGGS